MASQGPLSPGTIADRGNGVAWTNPGNVASSNDAYATVALNGTSAELRVTNFGFTVPAGATIDGVLVEAETKASAGFALVGSAKIAGPTTPFDSETRSDGAAIGTGESYKTYGGATDQWGLGSALAAPQLTAAAVNASTFGADFLLTNSGAPKSTVTGSVDHIRITVFYTPAPAVPASGFRSMAKRNRRTLGRRLR